ncbi:chemotaxis protein CheW [Massilia glaciei]|uniref:Chemotaxis protein CheW n=1 Tax=Massilia glaciei TaxID=1524097 RepID=A0A2U2I5Z2_9BURK|nr:chemotaxis protein CheW [Massilia glaciei]PWF55065.1 chemotaxis protein CheW [Massilia glaciei]
MHPDAVDPAVPGARKFLSFGLGGLEYGLDADRVRELRPLTALERVSNEGQIVHGVALARGVIMPLVDMRVALGTRPSAPDRLTDVIILQLSSCVMGMVVDSVSDVVALEAGQISPIAQRGVPDYLMGLGQLEGRRLILVDIDMLMSVRRAEGARRAA